MDTDEERGLQPTSPNELSGLLRQQSAPHEQQELEAD
jgi:hypothetical protein